MSDDLSRLDPVKPEPGKYQWVKGKVTGIDDKQAERTHTVGVPYLMPGVVIFVHGVNSDGEWYFDASTEFQDAITALFYLGIRSEVVAFDAVMNRTTLIIDAANDQYLVAPVTRGGINCSSGGGGCGDKMPYSTDGGRTWKRVWSPGTTYDLMVSGSMAYQSFTLERVHTDGLDLTLSKPTSTDWTSVSNFVFKPRIAPEDTKVRCSAKPEGSQR